MHLHIIFYFDQSMTAADTVCPHRPGTSEAFSMMSATNISIIPLKCKASGRKLIAKQPSFQHRQLFAICRYSVMYVLISLSSIRLANVSKQLVYIYYSLSCRDRNVRMLACFLHFKGKLHIHSHRFRNFHRH